MILAPNPFLPQPPGTDAPATDALTIRRRVAESMGYPDGVFDAILKAEEDHPGWSIIWSRTRFNRPANYSAHRPGQASTDAIIYAPDLATLVEKISSAAPLTTSSDT